MLPKLTLLRGVSERETEVYKSYWTYPRIELGPDRYACTDTQNTSHFGQGTQVKKNHLLYACKKKYYLPMMWVWS